MNGFSFGFRSACSPDLESFVQTVRVEDIISKLELSGNIVDAEIPKLNPNDMLMSMFKTVLVTEILKIVINKVAKYSKLVNKMI